MSRRHTLSISNEFVRNFKTSLFVALFLSQQLAYNDRYLVSAAISSGSQSSSSNSTPEKIGVIMQRQPESTIAPLYDEVLFECGLNFGPDRIEWRFRPQKQRTYSNNANSEFMPLTKTNGYNISTDDNFSKLRVYVNQQSAGEYQCVAWLGPAALASTPAKLILADISVNTSVNPRMLHWKVHPGNSILINCGDVISNPAPVWNFYKDNQLIPTRKQLATGALVLQSVTQMDSGTYWCSAMNTITGNEVKTLQKVSVTVDNMNRGSPALLYNSPSTVIVKPGATAILECPGFGNPVPKATWSRPDASISNNRTSIFGYGLQILNARREDRGEYICRLDNGIAPVKEHQIQLEILEVPKITKGPIDKLKDEGERLEMECEAVGFPTPTTYWLINGEDTRLDSSIRTDGTKLIIESLQKKHAGIIQCFARNEEGEVVESKLLQVKPKQISGDMISSQPFGTIPHMSKSNHERKMNKGRKKPKHTIMVPPSRPNVTRLSDDKVMVRWSVSPRESLPIQFFKVQYRLIGNTHDNKRSQWMTANDDIPPSVFMYEVDNLKPNNTYRFRIAAVYSNNDNTLSNVSKNFLLLRGSEIPLSEGHLPAPNLTSVEPISENSVVLHWVLPEHNQTPFDGFYAHYRPASTAGEYSKATVDGMDRRNFRIDNLEPGTAYEFKLQSYTSSAASDFMAIITGKTLKPSTPSPIDTSVNKSHGESQTARPYVLFIAGATGACSILVLTFILLCFLMKRRKDSDLDDTNDNKAHPDHIQTEANGFPVGNTGTNGRIITNSPVHKTSRLNGVVPRMNITPNPLAGNGDGEKNRTVMELRFLPSSITPGLTENTHIANNNCEPVPNIEQANRRNQHRQQQQQLNGALLNGLPPIQNIGSTTELGIPQTDINNRIPSLRRTPRRTTGNGAPVPNSPRFMRNAVMNNDVLHNNRSPIPSRVAAAVASNKRHRLGSRNNENISCGSLNSIEV